MARKYSMDRRAYLKTVGASGAALSLAGCLGGGGGGEMSIVAGTAPGFPPFEIKEGGELTGFDIELFEAVVAETDYTLESWSEFEFDSLIPALTGDQIDAIAAAMTINDERKQTIAFTDPYYNADQSVLVRDDGSYSPSSTDDFTGNQIGAQKGTTGESQIQALIEDGTLEESNYSAYDNYTLAVQDLENGNIEAIVLDQPVAETFQDQRAVTVAFTIETGERYGFGIRQDDSDLAEALNTGLATVQDDGTYAEIRNEWFGN